MTLVFFALCVTACGAQGSTAISRLQHKIPFTLILPKYFPAGFDSSRVSTTGPEKDKYVRDAEALIVTINYGKVGSNHSISITEENNERMFIQSDPTSTMLDIHGTLVLEDERQITKPTRHMEYNWDYRGIYIKVLIYGYDKLESEKIIESMIPPL